MYPESTGKDLGYGGSAPAYSGSVVLDLKRINRILEVNEDNAYALVEPGVSYFDLYRYIQEKGIKLWVDVPDPGWGSPIGNSLDRGGGYLTALYRNHFDSHCGMEVVLANGEILRTGMGAMPGREYLATIQIRLRPVDRRNIFAIEFRRDHEDGFLATAPAGCLSFRHRNGPEAQRPEPDDRYPQLARKHELHHRHAVPREPAVKPRRTVRPRRTAAGRRTFWTAGQALGRKFRGARRICAAKRNRLFQLHAELLRRGRSQRRELGVRERKILRDSRREIHRWRRPTSCRSLPSNGTR